jgi:peptidoglycan/LPS O-acetylase OafA/YrhL
VVIALVPVFAQYTLSALSQGLPTYSLPFVRAYISPNGELLIVAVALVAEAGSEMWRRQIPRWQKNLIGTACIGFVILATYVFSGIPTTLASPVHVSALSSNLFIFGFAVCITCKVAGRS